MNSLLFVCTGNSARSQMAEGFARRRGSSGVRVDSAGVRPAGLNPYAVWAMNEVGIDISKQTSDSLSDKDLRDYDHFITLCGDARDSCPALPPELRSEHWDLPDPGRIWGTPAERMGGFRVVRYLIEQRVMELLDRLAR
jgi:arsenate reductase